MSEISTSSPPQNLSQLNSVSHPVPKEQPSIMSSSSAASNNKPPPPSVPPPGAQNGTASQVESSSSSSTPPQGHTKAIPRKSDSLTDGAFETQADLSLRYREQIERVKRLLSQTNMFHRGLIDDECKDFYNNLGLNEYYFQTNSPETIAKNLQCVMAAKILNKASNSDIFPVLQQETDSEVFWMARSSLLNRKQSQNYTVEKSLEEKYLQLGNIPAPGEEPQPAWRLQCYRSTGSIFDDPSKHSERLRTYFLQKAEYPQYTEEELENLANETEWGRVADVYFYEIKKGTETDRIFAELNARVIEDNTGLNIFIHVEPRDGGEFRFDVAFRRHRSTTNFFSVVGDTMSMWSLYSQRKYSEPLANGVTIITCFVSLLPDASEVLHPEMELEKRIERVVKSLKMQFILPRSPFTDLSRDRLLSVHESAYAYSVFRFIYQFSASVGVAFFRIAQVLEGSEEISIQELNEVRTRLKRPPFSEEVVTRIVSEYPEMVKLLYKEFQDLHHPTVYKTNKGKLNRFEDESHVKQEILKLDDPEAIGIFRLFRLLNKHVVKTNFWKDSKTAISFRLDPSFLPESDYPDLPHAIVFVVGNGFFGFHCRFSEVARGGIRVVWSTSQQAYLHNRQRAFDECYNLSRTQHNKNKDIPEGGAKGVILLALCESAEEAQALTPLAFKAYVDGVLDLLLPSDRIVDRLKEPEVLFFGPDEHTGTGGLMEWAALHARKRGGWFWKAFTTGKSPEMGGIPHDIFGMTTTSVEAYITGIYEKCDLDECDVTKLQIGGPDGDLGSNGILMSKSRIIGIADGSGVLFDPEGLDRSELERLARLRFDKGPEHTNAMLFNEAKLSKAGMKVPVTEKDVQLPDGTILSSGRYFRDQFHLFEFVQADVFNPCGGRPESINAGNVARMFMGQDIEKGKPRFKYVVEGANVFITDDARRILEKKGVVLFKDASANKGGVTSSSLEVLAALSMTDEEFDANMRAPLKDGGQLDLEKAPSFYRRYVDQVKQIIKKNARMEFEALWEEGDRTGKPRCDLTDQLSMKIIQLNNDIQQQARGDSGGSLWHDDQLRRAILDAAIPDALCPGLMSIDTLQERVPEPYLLSLFSSFLAARFYYLHGIEAKPFAFFDFVSTIRTRGWKHFDNAKVKLVPITPKLGPATPRSIPPHKV